MIVNSPLVGEGLVLWSGEHAILRERTEAAIHSLLSAKGFLRVYTPYITKSTKFASQPWPPARNDGELYQYLPRKWSLHLLIATEEPLSYRQLPVMLYEVCECYHLDGGTLKNRPGVVLTWVGQYDRIESAMPLLLATHRELPAGALLAGLQSDARILSEEYTTPDNTKAPLALVSLELAWCFEK